MLDSNPRKKMISLRLSDGEYEVLKTHFRTYGARNISDFARLALQRIMTMPVGQPGDMAAKIAELDDRIHLLESYVGLMASKPKTEAAWLPIRLK